MMRICSFIALIAIAPMACLPNYEQSQGERVLYEHSEGLYPCAGTAHYVDRVVPFLEKQLAFRAPERLRFSWIAASDSWMPLGVPTLARAVGDHAWATDPIHIHELTHVITGGMPAMFFSEGIATAVDLLDDDVGPRYVWSDSALAEPAWDPRTTMTATNPSDVNYETAAVFVTFLIVRYGPERFHEFYRSLGGPVTMPWLQRQFRRAYGLELADEIATFRERIPPCEADAHPLNVHECSGPSIDWSSEKLWEHEVSMACDAPGVVGGIGPDWVWPSFYAVTLEVPERGYYTLWLDNTEVTARFGPCFGCPWEPHDVFLARETSERTMVLEPGTYYLRVNSQSDESPAVTVRLQRQ
ncbi:hypothetical protein [Nannocystis bainbridge]|uniref:Peptidase MA-like domain-containing protein n=1 Tax=Nannocystis bainbridge TaxID=2995303 RepID=A0ABT5DXR2_9BACT|nr:hypothetical protein [Nannocystis bainbridge]MDC0718384.1 hypothetical protein [Nannocystis bainbridge]